MVICHGLIFLSYRCIDFFVSHIDKVVTYPSRISAISVIFKYGRESLTLQYKSSFLPFQVLVQYVSRMREYQHKFTYF